MADAIKLPGTEMEISEKYPDSRRLDHPDFGDVCKTSFAKGVITEMKMIPPELYKISAYGESQMYGLVEPLEKLFKSLAKVQIEGGIESDYLPIFYHPKEKYWDTPSHEAKEFNQETGYFENAWMGFRAGDEVAVMLKEGIPVAVMGFADGKPRLGEAVCQIHTEAYTLYGTWPIGYQLNCPAQDFWQVAFNLTDEIYQLLNENPGKGPDGLSLGCINPDEIDPVPVGIITDSYEVGSIQVIFAFPTPHYITAYYQVYLFEYYCVIGPAIYFIQIMSIGNVGGGVSKDRFWIIDQAFRMYVGSFTPDLYNAIKSMGGSSAASAFQTRNACYQLPEGIYPPDCRWGGGLKLPDSMFVAEDTIGFGPTGCSTFHPLAQPSWKFRPHNPVSE